jgi:alpha-1,2-glucosyltransferase
MSLILFFFAFQLFSFYIYNTSLVDYYIDEVYHIPQAKHYIKGNFGYWNPMITTPPGLYIWTTLILYPFKRSLTVVHFRIVNFLFGMSLPLIMNNPKTGIIISLLPLVHPYGNLFYTDMGSLFLMLLSIKLFESHCMYWSAMVICSYVSPK